MTDERSLLNHIENGSWALKNVRKDNQLQSMVLKKPSIR